MKLDFIPLDKLSIDPANMRAKGREPYVGDILPSVRKRGVLVPLLARPAAEAGHFRVTGGRRRFTAANIVVREGGPARPLPCAILEDDDDVDAIEASMLENLARVAPDEVSQWEAFVKLAKAGRSEAEIADAFAFEPQAVKRILALGNLLPRVRTLYRAGDIDQTTVRQLTLASKSQQTAWLALWDDESAYCPTGFRLKGWLFGGEAIKAEQALFDVETAGVTVIADLFGDGALFADVDAFWTRQMAEVEARKTAYLDDGWSDVVILERGQHFNRWQHSHAPKRKGGRVYVEVRDSGEVIFHEAWLTEKEAAARARGDKGEAPVKVAKPEVTAAMNDYIGLHRHAAVRADLARHGAVALCAMAAHVIASDDHYRVIVDARRAPKPEIADSAETASAETAFDLHRRAVLDLLGFDPETPTIAGGGYGKPAFAPLFARLLDLPDAVVLEIVAIVMGETLCVGSPAVEAIGHYLGTDMAAHWQADTAFFSLLRDREVLLAMVAEVAGVDVADANKGEKAKVLKAIIADHLGGANGRAKVERWVPKWMAFPPASYTARGGVASVTADARAAADIAEEIDRAARAAAADASGAEDDEAPADSGADGESGAADGAGAEDGEASVASEAAPPLAA